MKTKVLIKCIMFIFTTGSFQLLNAQLPAAEYQPGIAILTGDIRNFQPEQNLDIRFAPSNLIMGRSEPTFVQPDSTGHFRQVVQLKYKRLNNIYNFPISSAIPRAHSTTRSQLTMQRLSFAVCVMSWHSICSINQLELTAIAGRSFCRKML